MRVATRRLRAALEVFEPCFPAQRHQACSRRSRSSPTSSASDATATSRSARWRLLPSSSPRPTGAASRASSRRPAAGAGRGQRGSASLRLARAGRGPARAAPRAGAEAEADGAERRTRTWPCSRRPPSTTGRGSRVKAKKVKKLDPAAAPRRERRADRARAPGRAARVRRRGAGARRVRDQHDMRIAAKRLRYVLEATELCFGKRGTHGAAQAKRPSGGPRRAPRLRRDAPAGRAPPGRASGAGRRRGSRPRRRRAGPRPRAGRQAPPPHRLPRPGRARRIPPARRKLLFDRFAALWHDLGAQGNLRRARRAPPTEILAEAKERPDDRGQAERAPRPSAPLSGGDGETRIWQGVRPGGRLAACSQFGASPHVLMPRPRGGRPDRLQRRRRPRSSQVRQRRLRRRADYDVTPELRPRAQPLPRRDADTAIAARGHAARRSDQLPPRLPRAPRSPAYSSTACPPRFSRNGQELRIEPDAPLADGADFEVEVPTRARPGRSRDPDGSIEGWVPTATAPSWSASHGQPRLVSLQRPPLRQGDFEISVEVPEAVQGRLERRPRPGRHAAAERGSSVDARTTDGHLPGHGHRRQVRRRGGHRPARRHRVLLRRGRPALRRRRSDRTAASRSSTYFDDILRPVPVRRDRRDRRPRAGVGYALETQTRPIYPAPPGSDPRRARAGAPVVRQRDHARRLVARSGSTRASRPGRSGGGTRRTVGRRVEQRLDEVCALRRRERRLGPAARGRSRAEEMFVEGVYTRGGAALQALRELIGDADFFAAPGAVDRAGPYGTSRPTSSRTSSRSPPTRAPRRRDRGPLRRLGLRRRQALRLLDGEAQLGLDAAFGVPDLAARR